MWEVYAKVPQGAASLFCSLLFLLLCLQRLLTTGIAFPTSRPEATPGPEPVLTVASISILWGVKSSSYPKAWRVDPQAGPLVGLFLSC